MTWSGWDVAVAVVFVAQLVGWLAVVAVALKIKSGPVANVQSHARSVLPRVQRLATLGKELLPRLLAPTQRLALRAKAIRKRLDVTTPPTGMWIEPRHVRQALGLAATVRARRAQPKTSVKRKSKPKNIAVRLGLVPPLLTRLAPLAGVARVALQTLRQLRR